MENTIFLSVIVTVYNVAKFLPQCMDSILKQTYNEIEILMIDDGSTDESPQICDKYAEQDDRVRVIHKENGGAISARKRGVNEARGLYIGFVDADDFIDDTMYEKLCNKAKEFQADLVMTDNDVWVGNRIIQIKQNLKEGLYDKKDLVSEIYPNIAFRDSIYQLGISPFLCTKIFRSEILVKYQNLLDERIKGGEDAACSYPCILQADSLYYIANDFPYHYRVHKQSMIHKKQKVDAEERVVLLNHFYQMSQWFSYEGLERQIALYGASVIESICFSVLQDKIPFGEQTDMFAKIRECKIWNLIYSLLETEKLPVTTQSAIEYVHSMSSDCGKKIVRQIRKRNVKKLIKRVIYRE